MAVHESLTTPESAVERLAHDTWIHLVREGGSLQVVRVAIPEAWDGAAFHAALVARYAARGHDRVEVHVLPTSSDPRVLSVVTER